MLAQQGFSVIYNKLIVLAAAIMPRKLVRFTSNSSQLSWSKGGQKLDKNGTKTGQNVAILGYFWQNPVQICEKRPQTILPGC